VSAKWNWSEVKAGKDYEFQGYSDFSIMTPIKGLVREIVQNSWDARRDRNGPLLVKFRFATASNPDREKYLAKELWSHLEQGLVEMEDEHGPLYEQLRDKGKWSEELRYLEVSDFHTTGLNGDEEETKRTKKSKETNVFRQFHHSFGVSEGNTTRGGSWGFGKAVTPYASKIKTFFALSVRDKTPDLITDDLDYSLLGQSIIKNHFLPHVDPLWEWSGYYSIRSSPSSDNLPVTKTNLNEINTFIKAFKLDNRTLKEEDRGLTLIIPYPKDGITPGNVAKEIIINYLQLLNAGKLEIEIIDEDKSLHWNITKNDIGKWLDDTNASHGTLLGWDE